MAQVKDIQEYREKKRKKEHKSFLIKLAVFLSIAALISAFVMLYEPIFGESLLESLGLVEPPKGYPVAITGTTPKGISVLGKNSALLNDTEITIYDEYGTLASSYMHNCTNPRVRTAGGRAIVYDVGYYSYLILNGANAVENAEYENQIIAADISSKGSYAIASASSKYLTELVVKNKNNTQTASWRSVGSYINALAFSEDSTRLAATALYSDGGLIKTTLRILDLTNEQSPVVTDKEFYGSAAISVEYLDNGNIFVLCDDRSIITDPNGETLLEYRYSGILYYYNLNQYGAFVVCEKDGEYTATMLYDAKNVGASMKISGDFKTQEHNGSDVYILQNDELVRYDREFNRVHRQSGLEDAVGMACSEDRTFILTFSQIRIAE